jgi:hypothetical protein
MPLECILLVALTVPSEADEMRRVGVYEQIKAFFQDIIAPALHELRGEIHATRADLRRIDEKIDSLDARLTGKVDSLDGRLTGKLDALAAQMGHMKGELIAEIRRLDARVDGVDRELRTAIDIRERLAALEARRA